MFARRIRLGIRAQLTLVVLLGAILSTVATLFIAGNAISNYALQQARTQETQNMKFARLVLSTTYGQSISISADGNLVVNSPAPGYGPANDFGRYQFNGDNNDFVDTVQQNIGGIVTIFQCADARSNVTPCRPVATTMKTAKPSASGLPQRDFTLQFSQNVARDMNIGSGRPTEWLGIDNIKGSDYYTAYSPLVGPQGDFVGVMMVGVPLDAVTAFQRSTAVQLILLGVIIMIAGLIFALVFASAIVNTLQRVARQVSGASERISGIAAQQSGGASQQVWAVNAINKALGNFSAAAHDISQRTDQLATMGTQVIQRRGEIPPGQIDQILAYFTRSVRDISVTSRQQAQQYERMSGAMQAVIEIAEQVAGDAQQSSESAERLGLVVRQLQQLVGVQRLRLGLSPDDAQTEAFAQMPMTGGWIVKPGGPSGGMNGAGQLGARGPLGQPMGGAFGGGQAPMQLPAAPGGAMGGGMGGAMMPPRPGMAGAGMRGSDARRMMGDGAGAPRGPMGGGMPQGPMGGGMPQGPMGGGMPQGPMGGGMPQGPMGGGMPQGQPGQMRPGPMGQPGNGMPPGGQEWRVPPMPPMPPMPPLGGLDGGPAPRGSAFRDQAMRDEEPRTSAPSRGYGRSDAGPFSDPRSQRDGR